MAIQKTATGDLTTAIAKQIYQTAVTADAYRQDAKGIIDPEKAGVDDFMLGRGEFFGHAAAARATSWLPKRFQHQMPDLRGTDYLMRGQRRSLMTPFASPINPKPTSAQAMARAGGRPFPFIAAETGFRPDGNNPSSMTPKFSPLSQKNDMFGLRSLGKGVKVREEKLGKFLAAILLSITKSLASINKKVDETEEGVIVAKDGIAATHKQLEDNSDMLATKLDAIIDALRIQTDAQRRESDRLEGYMKEATLEQEEDRSDATKIRMADEDDQEFALKMEEDDRERQADIQDNEQQLNIPIATGENGEGFAKGGIVSGPDDGYLALLHGDEMITSLDNNWTQGQTLATNPIMSAETGLMPGNNPKSMTPKFSPAPAISSPKASVDSSGGDGTNLLAQAMELPAKAAGIVTMGLIGEALAKTNVPGSVVPEIQSTISPIASAFGVTDVVSQNIARSAGVAGSEKARLASGSKPDASGEGKKQNFLQRVWSWIRGEGGGVNLTRNYRGGAGGGYQIGNISESSYGGVGGMVNTISNSAYGGDNNVAFNWGNPVDKMKFDPANPDRENPHQPGSMLYNIWQRRLQEYNLMKEAGMISSVSGDNWIFNKNVTPPNQFNVVSNLVNSESMDGEIRDLITDVAHDPDVVLNNQSQGTTDNQVEYSPIAAKGDPFPVGFNISPYA